MEKQKQLYGIMAEFDDPDTLIHAAKILREKGYKNMDAFTPFPVHGLDEAISFSDPRILYMIFFGGVIGALCGYGMQYWVCVIDYPLNIGGRPLHSWPSFIPVTFECTILFAAITAVFGMLTLNGLPRLYHPVFDCTLMKGATQDKFLLCVESKDPLFKEEEMNQIFQSLNALQIEPVHSEDVKGY